MKKLLVVILTGILLLSLTACGRNMEKPMIREGVKRCALSKEEKRILNAFGMLENSQMIAFKAPRKATSMKVHVYRLDAAGAWEEYSGGGISIGKEWESVKNLTGLLTMELTESYGIKLHITCDGQASYSTDEIQLEKDIVSSSMAFLGGFQEIRMNHEIPVAMMTYSSNGNMKFHPLEDFFTPDRLMENDLVQAVTLEFSDQWLW